MTSSLKFWLVLLLGIFTLVSGTLSILSYSVYNQVQKVNINLDMYREEMVQSRQLVQLVKTPLNSTLVEDNITDFLNNYDTSLMSTLEDVQNGVDKNDPKPTDNFISQIEDNLVLMFELSNIMNQRVDLNQCFGENYSDLVGKTQTTINSTAIFATTQDKEAFKQAIIKIDEELLQLVNLNKKIISCYDGKSSFLNLDGKIGLIQNLNKLKSLRHSYQVIVFAIDQNNEEILNAGLESLKNTEVTNLNLLRKDFTDILNLQANVAIDKKFDILDKTNSELEKIYFEATP